MIHIRLLVYALLGLSVVGIGLTIIAHQWPGSRRWKVGVLLVLVLYFASYGLR